MRILPSRLSVVKNAVDVALILLLLVAAARPLVNPIDDPDFFWHLKTGDWIWEHRSLPREFLFSQTAPPSLNSDQRVAMTSYWGVQVLYHLLYATGGWAAIALLRAALMALLIGTLILRRKGRDRSAFLASALLGVIVMRLYPFERPQVFSFLFFSVLLVVLDRLKTLPAESLRVRHILVLPLLMVAWANCHGAFIIGQGVIGLFLAAEGLKFLHPALGPLPRQRYRVLLGAGIAGVLAALLNPNTWRVWHAADFPAWMKAGNMEYQSTLSFFRTYNSPAILVSWFLLAATLASFTLARKRPDITPMLLAAVTGAISLGTIRYLPFFILSTVPVIEAAFSGEFPGRKGRLLLIVPALAAGLRFLPDDIENLKRYPDATVVNPLSYPVDAADYIASHHLPGNLYNSWTWSGYLLWRLYPAKVFYDGRHPDYEAFRMNSAVEIGGEGPPGGEPYWRTVFQRYGIRYAVLPIFDPRGGDVKGLLFALAASPDWRPVFIGTNAVVFVEDSPETRRVGRLPLSSPEQFLGVLLKRCENLTRRYPDYPFPHIARGDLLVRLHRPEEAVAAYRSALRLVPFNHIAAGRLALLQTGRPAVER